MARPWFDTKRRTITDFLDSGRETVHLDQDLLAHKESYVHRAAFTIPDDLRDALV